MSITVLYYFQGEVGESLELPNAFVIPNNVIQNKTKGLTFDIFCKYFPFYNKGNYHYRVQAEDPSCEYIWIDIVSSDQVIPFYKNNIIFKILKLDEVYTLKRKSLLRRKIMNQNEQVIAKQSSFNSNTNSNSSFNSYNNSSHNNISNQSIDFKSTKSKEYTSHTEQPSINKSSQPKDSSTPPASTTKPSQPIQHNTENFLDFDDMSPIKNKQSTFPPSNHSHISSKPTTNVTFDPMDFNTSTAPSATPATTTLFTPQLDRAELKANLETKINDQVKKALDEKLEQDRKSAQAENDFDLAKQKHEQKLLAWSTNNKEKRNIRTLLSTMHNVLWSDTRWKTVGLGDLLEPKQVKLQYRKAMLVVHPDHCVNLSNENQFISKRIFEAVNEAYNEFLKKENV